jgi:hypothetical protein
MFQVIGLQFWSISIRPQIQKNNQIIVEKICESVAISKLQRILQNKIFEVISQASQELNVESYVIGGCEIYFKKEISKKDIDIVAVGSGIELALHVSKLLPINRKFKF